MKMHDASVSTCLNKLPLEMLVSTIDSLLNDHSPPPSE